MGNSYTTSTATNYSYSYTSDVRPTATIVNTKAPAKEWSDVIEISVVGMHLHLETDVKTPAGFGTIVEFEPSSAVVRVKGKRLIFDYDKIRVAVIGEKGYDMVPDPNRAFLRKKKGV